MEAGPRYWQVLPINPTSPVFDTSPYMSFSAFAGNPLLIDPVQLVEAGWLPEARLGAHAEFSDYAVLYDEVASHKENLLREAFQGFMAAGEAADFAAFCREEEWLDDYCLFMALRQEHRELPWNEWPEPLARRDPQALAEARERLTEALQYHRFVQYVFYRQWEAMKAYAGERGVLLVGDIPIYVSFDSADVWANPDCFKLDAATLQPTKVAGVPPDYFSATGQRWGNPIYRWFDSKGKLNQALYAWWRARFQDIFHLIDIIRIDHFRGFESYWEIPAEEETAIKGKWVRGPGKPFFDKMNKDLGPLRIIAEDLGIITPEVEALRDSLNFPGMKILQFAFDSDAGNAYLPHNYSTTNCVVYTGTHDNDTSLGWYFSERVPPASKERAVRYGHCANTPEIHWDFIRMAFSSVADIAIVPMQDVLGFGTDCRMNTPSTARGNWRWRLAERFMTPDVTARLRDESYFYRRGR